MLSDLFPDATDGLAAVEATFARDVAASSAPAYVIVPSFDEDLQHGPCAWPSRVNDSSVRILPQQGDRALVLIAQDTQEPWILGWWPYV